MRKVPPEIRETITLLRAMAEQAIREGREDDCKRYRAEARNLEKLKE